MGYERIKTEHAGSKNRGGAWMTRFQAKRTARRKRRELDKQLARTARGELLDVEPLDLDPSSPPVSRPLHLERGPASEHRQSS